MIDLVEVGNALASSSEDFNPRTHYHASGKDGSAQQASLRQQAHDFAAKQFQGVSSARSLAAGATFELSGHDVHDQDGPEQRQFVLTQLVAEAKNNFLQPKDPALQQVLGTQAEIPELLSPWFGNRQTLLDAKQEQPYRNILNCVRRGVPIRPRCAHTNYAKPTAPGPMTATVVGPEGAEIYTDELGRIKIEYDWQLPSEHPQGNGIACRSLPKNFWLPAKASLPGQVSQQPTLAPLPVTSHTILARQPCPACPSARASHPPTLSKKEP